MDSRQLTIGVDIIVRLITERVRVQVKVYLK